MQCAELVKGAELAALERSNADLRLELGALRSRLAELEPPAPTARVDPIMVYLASKIGANTSGGIEPDRGARLGHGGRGGRGGRGR